MKRHFAAIASALGTFATVAVAWHVGIVALYFDTLAHWAEVIA